MVFKDVEEVIKLTKNHPEDFSFDVLSWMSKPGCHVFKEKQDLGFAELKSNGIYWVHLCCTSKGSEALKSAEKFTKYLFVNYPCKTALGAIRDENRKAKWVIRKLGFRSLGKFIINDSLSELFYLNRNDYGFQ